MPFAYKWSTMPSPTPPATTTTTDVDELLDLKTKQRIVVLLMDIIPCHFLCLLFFGKYELLFAVISLNSNLVRININKWCVCTLSSICKTYASHRSTHSSQFTAHCLLFRLSNFQYNWLFASMASLLPSACVQMTQIFCISISLWLRLRCEVQFVQVDGTHFECKTSNFQLPRNLRQNIFIWISFNQN